jgi:hypothetical protein
MRYPWRYYKKSVGLWIVETDRSVYSFPLKTKGLDLESVSREYFHYLDDTLQALGDQFNATAIEYPPGETLVESPMPLYLFQSKQRLFEAWREDIKHCDVWAPGAVLRGQSEVAIQFEDRVISSQLPGVLSVLFSGIPGSDRYTLVLSTNCDIWLEKTISGELNNVGRANALRLERALARVVDKLDGKVVHYATEYEGVKIGEKGFLS